MATMHAAPEAVENKSEFSALPRSWFVSGPAIVLYVACAKLLLHLLTATRYGIFRDELYYLACAQHLAWGYVDQPPLVAFAGWLVRHSLGDSLIAIRLLPALSGAALVWLAGALTREMGGGRFAQAIAALAVLFAPFYLIFDHWLTMNAFEPLIWMGCMWCVLRAINTGQPRYWLWFGVIAGVGFENKYSIVFFLLGVLAGVLLTPQRRFLKSKYVWLGSLAAFLIFLPNFIWLVQHNFPFLELMHNVRMENRDIVRGPAAFVLDQAVTMGPAIAPLWLGGLVWLFFGSEGRRYRIAGWTYAVVLAIFIVLHGKNYYVVPIYPMLFAAGAVALEQVTCVRWRWSRTVYLVLLIVTGAVLVPTVVPVLSPPSFIRYMAALHLQAPKAENEPVGALPQYFADEFGWDDMVRETARIYHSLPPDEQVRTAIFANNYGEAAAIDFFGPKYGLPRSISAHQNYWYWGPRNYTGDEVIILGSDGSGDRQHFRSVEVAGRADNPYSRLDERYNIFLCRGLKWKLQDVWPQLKKWD